MASKPVASVMRLAARPVGAHSRSRTLFAARMRKIPLTMVVFPTPGPPVITRVLDMSASRIAAGASGNPGAVHSNSGGPIDVIVQLSELDIIRRSAMPLSRRPTYNRFTLTRPLALPVGISIEKREIEWGQFIYR